MATLTIRQLDDDVYRRLKERARDNHRSVEAEVRLLIAERLRTRNIEDAVTRFLATPPVDPGPDHPGSVELVRHMRDEE